MHNLGLVLASAFYLACPVFGWRVKTSLQDMQSRRWGQEDRVVKLVNGTENLPRLTAVGWSQSKRPVNVKSALHPLRYVATLLLALNPATGFFCSVPSAHLRLGTPSIARSHPVVLRSVYDMPVVQKAERAEKKKKKKKAGMRSEQREAIQEMEKALKSHCSVLTSALKSELDEELKASKMRLTEWPLWRLVKKGFACVGLIAPEKPEVFYLDAIVRFSSARGQELPFNRFTNGDMVRVRLDDGNHSGIPVDGAEDLTGVIVDRDKWSVRVSFPAEKIDLVRRRTTSWWRLDMMTNTVSFARKEEAVKRFSSSSGFPDEKAKRLFSPLHRALSGVQVGEKSLKVLAAHSATWKGKTRPSKERQALITKAIQRLNPSQREAIKAGLSRTLTLWQGPPGTGKTETTCSLISTAVSLISDSGFRGPKILASAASNVAVDNILMGLLRQPNPPNVVRVGAPASVTAGLRDHTLEAKIANHEAARNASELRENAAMYKGFGRTDLMWQFSQEAQKLETDIARDVLRSADVVLATCVSAAAGMIGNLQYSFCIIDEATQATEPDVLIALSKAHAAVLVGDPAQLPATVCSREAAEAGLGVSLFERLVASGLPPLLLDTQYRMHPGLAEFSSKNFYEGRIKSHPQPSDRIPPNGIKWPSRTPAAFFQCNGFEVRRGTTYVNEVEAGVVVRIVRSLWESGSITSLDDVGIVTPYIGQVRLLSERFSALGYATSVSESREFLAEESMEEKVESTNQTNQGKELAAGALEIRSVDAYQGREKEVMVFSTVRSNEGWGLGFVADKRRLNVAITRARRGLIVVGNARTLNKDPTWKDWLAWVKEQGAFTNVSAALRPLSARQASPQGFDWKTRWSQDARARTPMEADGKVRNLLGDQTSSRLMACLDRLLAETPGGQGGRPEESKDTLATRTSNLPDEDEAEAEHEWQRTLAEFMTMREAGVSLRFDEFGTAISACKEGEQWEQAASLLKEMMAAKMKPELSSFNEGMLACDKGRRWEEVLSLLADMRVAGVSLDALSFNTASSACAQGGQWECSLALLQEMQSARITPDSIRFCSAITASGKGGEWQQALLLIDDMSGLGITPNLFAYNAAISACEQNGQWEQALLLLARMGSKGVMPNALSFNKAILACEQANQLQRAASLREEMSRVGTTSTRIASLREEMSRVGATAKESRMARHAEVDTDASAAAAVAPAEDDDEDHDDDDNADEALNHDEDHNDDRDQAALQNAQDASMAAEDDTMGAPEEVPDEAGPALPISEKARILEQDNSSPDHAGIEYAQGASSALEPASNGASEEFLDEEAGPATSAPEKARSLEQENSSPDRMGMHIAQDASTASEDATMGAPEELLVEGAGPAILTPEKARILERENSSPDHAGMQNALDVLTASKDATMGASEDLLVEEAVPAITASEKARILERENSNPDRADMQNAEEGSTASEDATKGSPEEFLDEEAGPATPASEKARSLEQENARILEHMSKFGMISSKINSNDGF